MVLDYLKKEPTHRMIFPQIRQPVYKGCTRMGPLRGDGADEFDFSLGTAFWVVASNPSIGVELVEAFSLFPMLKFGSYCFSLSFSPAYGTGGRCLCSASPMDMTCTQIHAQGQFGV